MTGKVTFDDSVNAKETEKGAKPVPEIRTDDLFRAIIFFYSAVLQYFYFLVLVAEDCDSGIATFIFSYVAEYMLVMTIIHLMSAFKPTNCWRSYSALSLYSFLGVPLLFIASAHISNISNDRKSLTYYEKIFLLTSLVSVMVFSFIIMPVNHNVVEPKKAKPRSLVKDAIYAGILFCCFVLGDQAELEMMAHSHPERNPEITDKALHTLRSEQNTQLQIYIFQSMCLYVFPSMLLYSWAHFMSNQLGMAIYIMAIGFFAKMESTRVAIYAQYAHQGYETYFMFDPSFVINLIIENAKAILNYEDSKMPYKNTRSLWKYIAVEVLLGLSLVYFNCSNKYKEGDEEVKSEEDKKMQ